MICREAGAGPLVGGDPEPVETLAVGREREQRVGERPRIPGRDVERCRAERLALRARELVEKTFGRIPAAPTGGAAAAS